MNQKWFDLFDKCRELMQVSPEFVQGPGRNPIVAKVFNRPDPPFQLEQVGSLKESDTRLLAYWWMSGGRGPTDC